MAYVVQNIVDSKKATTNGGLKVGAQTGHYIGGGVTPVTLPEAEIRARQEAQAARFAPTVLAQATAPSAGSGNMAAVSSATQKATMGINPNTATTGTQTQTSVPFSQQLSGGGTYTAASGYAGLPAEVAAHIAQQEASQLPVYTVPATPAVPAQSVSTEPSYAQLLQEAQQAQLESYAQALQAAIDGYESQRGMVGANADEARAAAYANGRVSAIGNNERLAAAGLAGNLYATPQSGYSETSRIAQDNALRSNLNAVAIAQMQAEAEIDQAIADARANGEINRANLIAENAQTLINLRMQEAQQQFEREMASQQLAMQQQQMAYQQALGQQQLALEQQQQAYAQEQAAQQLALARAETLAGYGDFSGYSDLGWDTSIMQQAYQQAQDLQRAKALASSRDTEPAVGITSGSFFTEMMASPNPVQYLAQNAYQLTDAQLKQLYPYALDWLENDKTGTELAKREQEQAERVAAIASQDAKFEMFDRWYRSNTEEAFERILAQKYLDGTIAQKDIDAWTKARGID